MVAVARGGPTHLASVFGTESVTNVARLKPFRRVAVRLTDASRRLGCPNHDRHSGAAERPRPQTKELEVTGYSDVPFGANALGPSYDLDDLVVPMNPVVGRAWVDALRSDRYPQGQGRLVSRPQLCGRPHFCCLGVLCDLAVRAGIVRYDPVKNDFRDVRQDPSGGLTVVVRESSALPEVVARWAGLWHEDPYVRHGNDRVDSLSILNDNLDYGFHRIADAIENSLIVTGDLP